MQQKLLFVTRQSPDWRSLADDFGRGLPIDPGRFRPAEKIPGFPDNIVELVDQWNAAMSVDFFSCRSRLKDIADDTLAQLPDARRVSLDQVSGIGSEIEDYVVFFHDDDDWFSPQLPEMLSGLSSDDYDVCVFSLVRLWTETLTLVRRGQQSSTIVGVRQDANFKYQSNNYGLNGRVCDRETLVAMKDHVLASEYGAKRAFRDVYIEQIIGVTAKTPCSASILPAMFSQATMARWHVQRYIATLQALPIPKEVGWITEHITKVTELFSSAVAPSA